MTTEYRVASHADDNDVWVWLANRFLLLLGSCLAKCLDGITQGGGVVGDDGEQKGMFVWMVMVLLTLATKGATQRSPKIERVVWFLLPRPGGGAI